MWWLLAMALAGEPAESEAPFTWEVPAAVIPAGEPARLVLELQVPAGTMVYRDQIEVRLADSEGVRAGALSLPDGKEVEDPAFVEAGAVREVYDSDVTLFLALQPRIDGDWSGAVTVHTRVQGCKPGLCWPPREEAHQTLVVLRDAAAASE